LLGVLLGKLLTDCEAVAVALECPSQVALSALRVADSVVADEEVSLRARIAGILLGKLLTDCEAVAVALERAKEVALILQHVADFVVDNGEIAQAYIWVLLGKFKAVAVGLCMPLIGLGDAVDR
jgi:hypothetical protein